MDDTLPFADYEFTLDTNSKDETPKSVQSNSKIAKKGKKSKKSPSSHQKSTMGNSLPFVYFENSHEMNNILSFVTYTGPCNTNNLRQQLYIPLLVSTTTNSNDSSVHVNRFLRDYDEKIQSVVPSLGDMSLAFYLRFGISYIIFTGSFVNHSLSINDYLSLRRQGKQMKTAFYTCKGVTTPKRLLTTVTKFNYEQAASNNYSYDIQLYRSKNDQSGVLHFQFDEKFQCRSVFSRPFLPTNFDFIREKSSSQFRSIDDSYADIFDFRIQLVQTKYFSQTDPLVLEVLRGVPIDQVLYIDKSTQLLHVAQKLQRFVKYLKCNLSNTYQNFAEKLLIMIGSYEEYHLNPQGICESSMKAENTMTIEYLDQKTIPSGKKLYDLGIWFSSLCQICVDPSISTSLKNEAKKPCRWFSGISSFAKKYQQTTKQTSAHQLTIYQNKDKHQSYTSEDVAFVRNIIHEENLRKILFINSEENEFEDKSDLDRKFETIKQKLENSSAPLAKIALKRLQRAYLLVCQDFTC